MGLILYPVFERDFKAPPSDATGEFLANSFDTLDQIASEHGLKPISTFGDSRTVPEDFEGDPDELDEVMGPCTDWYDSRDGVTNLRELLNLISSRSDLANRLDSAEAVIDELRSLIMQLEVSSKEGIRFRLELE